MGSKKKVWCLPRKVVDEFEVLCEGIVRLPEPTDCINDGIIKLLQNKGAKIPRRDAEGNKEWVQLVVGGIVVVPEGNEKKILVIERFETEKRLKGLWTAFIGGHLEDLDLIGECIREMEEELGTDDFMLVGTPYAIWYPVNDVSEEHLGIIYVIYTTREEIKNKQLNWRLINKEELKDMEKDSWTEAIANLLEVHSDVI